MKTFIALLLMLAASVAHADTPCAPPACSASIELSATNVAPGSSITVIPTVLLAAGGSGYVLQSVIYDPNGNRLGSTWQDGLTLPSGQSFVGVPLTYLLPPNTPTGVYTVAVGVFGANRFWQSGVASFTVGGAAPWKLVVQLSLVDTPNVAVVNTYPAELTGGMIDLTIGPLPTQAACAVALANPPTPASLGFGYTITGSLCTQ